MSSIDQQVIESGYIKQTINDKLSYYSSCKIGSQDMSEYEKLIIHGVTTVKVYDPEVLPSMRQQMLDTINGFPEFNKDLDQPVIPVLGGFGALANPASFHNLFVRRVRIDCFLAVSDLLDQVIENTINPKLKESYKKVALFDRMMWRRAGQAPMAESWHRDVMETKQINEGDIIYGGWVNLDDKPQSFSCIIGSHLGQSSFHLTPGFATIEKLVNNKEEMARVTADKVTISIPPGHMIVFPQYIIHEVVAVKRDYDMFRVFTSWALLTSDKSIYVDKNGIDKLEQIMENQEVPQLPGGMIPPICAANHIRFPNREITIVPGKKETKMNLSTYSTKFFKPVCLIKKADGKSYVKRHMDSLKQLQLPLYQSYSKEEVKMYKPCK